MSYGVINRKMEYKKSTHSVDSLRIKTASLDVPVNQLSGGNQQKVVLGKWLMTRPMVLFLDEPTRGIDVGAKAEIHALTAQLADEGVAIVLVSSELPEILGMSDRVLVLHEGRITGEFVNEKFDARGYLAMCSRGVMEKVFRTESPEETQALGEELGKTLKPGDVIALIGDLGTGKTCLTQGIARGVGIAQGEVVSSPSYILINEYNGKIPIYHIDLYRLETLTEIADLGLGEYVESDGICIIEWAERMADGLPDTCIRIYISWEDENTRSIKIQHSIS